MKVLIAEDDRRHRRRLSDELGRNGYLVHAVSDGQAAWRVLNLDDPPRLVVLDWRMPGPTGVEICRRLRRKDEGEYAYVVLMTSAGREGACLEGFGAGVDDYLVKPFDPRELCARLRAGERILELYGEITEIYRTAPVSMILIDESGHIRRVNRAGIQLTECSQEEILCRPFGVALGCIHAAAGDGPCSQSGECDQCQLRNMIQDTARQGTLHYRQEARISQSLNEDEDLWYLVTTRAIPMFGEQMTMICLEDITMQKQAERDLTRTVAELEAFNRLAIDRELRMIELKQQVNDYARRLGIPEPHPVGFAASAGGLLRPPECPERQRPCQESQA